MSQKHRLRIESAIGHAQKTNLPMIAVYTNDAAQVLAEFYRLQERLVRTEQNFRKRLKQAKRGTGEGA